MAVGHARRLDIDEGESRESNCLFDELGQASHVGGGTLSDEKSAVAHDKKGGIYRVFEAAKVGGDGFAPALGGGGQLTLGKAIDLIVHHDIGQVDVAPNDVGDVAAADGESV